MAKRHTDCVEKPIRVCFEFLGHFVGSHPWWFFVAPLVMSAALGSGFLFLGRNLSNDIERHFTPLDGPAKRERRFVQESFPQTEDAFSSLRLSSGGTYACFIATNHSNIWTVETVREVLRIDSKIRSMTARFEDELFEYVDVCSTVSGSCSSNGILEIIGYNASNVDHVNLTFPVHSSQAGMFDLRQTVGSVTSANNSAVQTAQAIRLYYYLREDNETKTDIWLEKFITLLSNESTASIQVSYSTSRSMQWEFNKIPDGIIHLFAITYTIAITFSILSSLRCDSVRSKVWVAAVGVLSSGLAVVSSFGLLLLLGQPFVITVAASPFMLLGVGLDDLFILLSSWQQTRVLDGPAERLAHTYKHAAVSVTVTTATDALALFLGFSSPFGSVQSFCLYAGTGIVFCYLYNLTFLGSFLVLNGRREAGSRHWLTCAPVPEAPPPGTSRAYGICCVGGAYDRDTGAEEEQPIGRFFGAYYGPFLTRRWTKACVAVLYAGYLAVAVYGCCLMKQGIDLRNLAADDSYVVRYYDDQSAHFAAYGPAVMVAVTTAFFPYWTPGGRRELAVCTEAFERLDYVEGSFSWLAFYQRYANVSRLDIGSEESFMGNLPAFLDRYPSFRQDLNMSDFNRIQSSRFFLQTLGRTSDAELLTGLRETAKRCPAVDLLVYHPSFIYFDQYAVVVDNTVQTVAVAMVAMLVVSLLLIPNPLCSLCVAFAVGSVMVGVAGFMSLWGVGLDAISMINLLICVGFSVDFSAHVCYAFVSSAKADADERAADALGRLGFPMVQGAASTVLGVLVLAASRCYVFKTFFKVMFLVISFGLVHGVIFIPVFLTLLGSWEVGSETN